MDYRIDKKVLSTMVLGMLSMVLVLLLCMATGAQASGEWSLSHTEINETIPYTLKPDPLYDNSISKGFIYLIDDDRVNASEAPIWTLKYVSGYGCLVTGTEYYSSYNIRVAASYSGIIGDESDGNVQYVLECKYRGETKTVPIRITVQRPVSNGEATDFSLDQSRYVVGLNEILTVRPTPIPVGVSWPQDTSISVDVNYSLSPYVRIKGNGTSVDIRASQPGRYTLTFYLYDKDGRIGTPKYVELWVKDDEGVLPGPNLDVYVTFGYYREDKISIYENASTQLKLGSVFAMDYDRPSLIDDTFTLERIGGSSVELELRKEANLRGRRNIFIKEIAAPGISVFRVTYEIEGEKAQTEFTVEVLPTPSAMPTSIELSETHFTAHIGDTITFQPKLLPAGSVLPEGYKAYLVPNNNSDRWFSTSHSLLNPPSAIQVTLDEIGFFSASYVIEAGKVRFEIPVTFYVVPTWQSAQLRLNALSINSEMLVVGETLKVEAFVYGIGKPEEMFYTVYDENNQVVAQKNVSQFSFDYIPETPGKLLTLVFSLKPYGSDVYQTEFRWFRVLERPAGSVELTGATLSKDTLMLGESVTIALQKMGDGIIDSISYIVYRNALPSVDDSYSHCSIGVVPEGAYDSVIFTPEGPGKYIISFNLVTPTGSNSVKTAILTVIDPHYSLDIASFRPADDISEPDKPKAFSLQLKGTGWLGFITVHAYDEENVLVDAKRLTVNGPADLTYAFSFIFKRAGTYHLVAKLHAEGIKEILTIETEPFTIKPTLVLEYLDASETAWTRHTIIFRAGIPGTGYIQEAIYEIYCNGELIHKESTTDSVYYFTASKPGEYKARLYLYVKYGDSVQIADSPVVKVTDPEPLKLEGISTNSRFGLVDREVSFKLQLSGLGSIDEATFHVYRDGEILSSYYRLQTDTLIFAPWLPGEYKVRVFLYVEGFDTVQEMESATYTVLGEGSAILKGLKVNTDTAYMGETLAYEVLLQGTGKIVNATYDVYRNGELLQSHGLNADTFSFTPTVPGDYMAKLSMPTLIGKEKQEAQSPVARVLSPTLTLKGINLNVQTVAVGQSCQASLAIEGKGNFMEAVYVVHDGNGLEVAREKVSRQTYAFVPQQPGIYTISATITVAGASDTQTAYSQPIIAVLPNEKLTLVSITGKQAAIMVGEVATYEVLITGKGKIEDLVYVVYDGNGGEVTRWAAISGIYQYTPKNPGNYVIRAFMKPEGEAYQYKDSKVLIVNAPPAPEKTVLRSISGPRVGAAGDSLSYGVYITGSLSAITDMVYVVYDVTGTEVARQAGIAGVYTFKPKAAGTYVVRAFMKVAGENTYQYVDSAPVVISGPAPEQKTELQSISGPKAGAVGDALRYNVYITGPLSAITEMVYVVYDSNGREAARKAGISGEYTFKPQASGAYVVRAFMKTKGDTVYHYVESAVVSINEAIPVENAELKSISGPTQANVGDRLVYYVYMTGELSTITEMAYVLYDSNGTEVARAVGISGEYAFTPGQAGTYVVRAFVKATGEKAYQMADTAVLTVNAAPPQQWADLEQPTAEPTVELATDTVTEPAQVEQRGVELHVEPTAEPTSESVTGDPV